jgi:hypothetical protein
MKSEISIALLKKDIKYMKEGIDTIKSSLDCMVKNDSEYKEVKTKVDQLWDDRNKLIGWLIGSGVIGGSVSVLAQSIVKTIQAKF